MSKRSTNKISSTFSSIQNFLASKYAVVLVILICLIFAIAFLYSPAKNYYHASRNHDKVLAQYEALKNSNDALKKDIELLQTEEGIKQRARDTLGLVENGESSGIVSGLSNKGSGSSSTFSTASDKLSYKQIDAPKTWYSPFLDKVFDYS